ncbi:hypothetical protein HYY71_03735 [Candidatus Woesearchaeota archaeon]|nr:hypothetical protein [Candidatus Woesearchaeota archaeon]
MSSKIEYKQSEYSLEKTKIELGLLGKFFGDGSKSAKNIIGLIALILLIPIIFALLTGRDTNTISALTYIFTICIGYLAGAKNS